MSIETQEIGAIFNRRKVEIIQSIIQVLELIAKILSIFYNSLLRKTWTWTWNVYAMELSYAIIFSWVRVSLIRDHTSGGQRHSLSWSSSPSSHNHMQSTPLIAVVTLLTRFQGEDYCNKWSFSLPSFHYTTWFSYCKNPLQNFKF